MGIKLSLPIAGANLKRYPQGLVSQFFGENLNPLYAKLGLKGHNGIDFGCQTRTPILAAHDGVVTLVYNDQNVVPADLPTKGYGVYLQHAEGWQTVYWHLLSPNVAVGQAFKEGDVLAYSDNTGMSTGPHLHFGLYPAAVDRENGYGGAIDPLPALQISILWQIVGILQKILSLKGRVPQ